MKDLPAEELKARRIRDAQALRTLYSKRWRDTEERRRNHAKVLRQLDGEKPYRDEDLVSSGQGWRCNVNFRDSEALLDQMLVSYWRLVHDVTNYVNVDVYDDSQQAEVFKQAAETAFNLFIDEWGSGYVSSFMVACRQMIALGAMAIEWPDLHSPRWRPIRVSDVLAPAKATADPDSWDYVLLRTQYTVAELWDLVRTPKAEAASEAAGWNIPALKRVLIRLRRGELNTPDQNDWVEVASELRSNSLGCSEEGSSLDVIIAHVKEFDGKITTTICPVHSSSDDAEYLFDDYGIEGRPTRMGERFTVVLFEVGDGRFYSVKGFGQKNFGIMTVLNRLRSRAVDRTVLDGLNFRDLSDGEIEDVPLVNVGAVNMFPRHLEQVPNYPTGRITLETLSMVESLQNFNNARYRDQGRRIQETDTATQARILANLQSEVDIANASFFLSQWTSNVLREQYRRLLYGKSEDAKAFRNRLLASGVDPEYIKTVRTTVRAGADPGQVSSEMQAQVAQTLIAAGGNPHVNERWAWETYIAKTVGASAVRRALNPVEELDDEGAQRSAMLENLGFGSGMPIPVVHSDKHHIHLPIHLQPLAAFVERYRESGHVDPQIVVTLQMALPHIEEHFAYLDRDPSKKETRDKLWNMYAEIRSVALGIFSQLEKASGRTEGTQPVAAASGGHRTT